MSGFKNEHFWSTNNFSMFLRLRLCFFLLLVASFNLLEAQGINNSLAEKLCRAWQWVSCKDTFTIQLFYIDTLWKGYDNKNSFGPKIYGWHRYVENGIEVESSFPLSSNQKPFSKGIYGMVMNKDSVLLWFKDITRDRGFRVKVDFLDSANTVIKWITHRPQERVVWDPSTKPKIWEGQTIPSPIILHKMPDL